MNILKDLLYTENHEWVKLEGDFVTIGITDFAQSELGDIVFLEIETLNETLAKEEVFGSIEAVKTVSDLFMPVSGEIIEINPDIENNPSIVNEDAYEKGWLVKVRYADKTELENLLEASAYEKLI